jgi:hypothetical protein
VISEYTKGIDPTVRIANAVNTLDKHTQELILKLIQSEDSPAEPVEVTPLTSISYNESNQTGGKNIFKCFLKVLSALGQKDCQINWQKVPDNYLALFITNPVDFELAKTVMSRYLYFDNFIRQSSGQTSIAKLYFGITDDLYLKYGFLIDDKPNLLGQFLLTQGTYNYIMTMDLKSSENLKKFLVALTPKRLNILSKIKSVMKDFFPGSSDSKIKPTIQNEIITYGFQGLGKWDNGIIDAGELSNIKSNLQQFLVQFPWTDDVQYNITSSEGWVFFNLKIK